MRPESLEIVLRRLDHVDSLSARHITLDSTTDHVVLGRASKDSTKSLVAKRDNLWFDKPVLSRSHATFSFCPSQKEAYLTDIKSTHGTFVKEHKLARGERITLNDGDVITFGASIQKDGETFIPLKVFINLKWREPEHPKKPALKPKPTNRFVVPDDDDSDSGESDSELLLAQSDDTSNIHSVRALAEDERSIASSTECPEISMKDPCQSPPAIGKETEAAKQRDTLDAMSKSGSALTQQHPKVPSIYDLTSDVEKPSSASASHKNLGSSEPCGAEYVRVPLSEDLENDRDALMTKDHLSDVGVPRASDSSVTPGIPYMGCVNHDPYVGIPFCLPPWRLRNEHDTPFHSTLDRLKKCPALPTVPHLPERSQHLKRKLDDDKIQPTSESESDANAPCQKIPVDEARPPSPFLYDEDDNEEPPMKRLRISEEESSPMQGFFDTPRPPSLVPSLEALELLLLLLLFRPASLTKWLSFCPGLFQ